MRAFKWSKLRDWLSKGATDAASRLETDLTGPGFRRDKSDNTAMHHVRQEDLPHAGSSHQFIGADQGNVGCSVYLLSARPGAGPGPHRHPYDEIQFVREGRGLWTVNGLEFEGKAGDIFVIKAGEVHGFKAIGDEDLVQVDVHMSPTFIQENL